MSNLQHFPRSHVFPIEIPIAPVVAFELDRPILDQHHGVRIHKDHPGVTQGDKITLMSNLRGVSGSSVSQHILADSSPNPRPFSCVDIVGSPAPQHTCISHSYEFVDGVLTHLANSSLPNTPLSNPPIPT